MTVEISQQPFLLAVGLPELALLCERATSELPAPLQPIHDAALRVRESTQALQGPDIEPLPERSVAEILAGLEPQEPEAHPPLDETVAGAFSPFDLEADDAVPMNKTELADTSADDEDDQAYKASLYRLQMALTEESDARVVREQLVELRAHAQEHPPHFGPVQRPIVALALARLAREDPYAAEVLAAASAGSRAEFAHAKHRVTGTIGAILVATRALRLL
ncbi:MAG TPA: hypothetical protein VGO07_00430 [Candidatus Saccharimonadales bacterium]|jgi:hypothetical protein|nr:hypothetical protein [Candidatus Saccharimonadales bacterium]